MAETKWKDASQNPVWRFMDFVDKKGGAKIEANGKVFIGTLLKKYSWPDKETGKTKNRYAMKDEAGKLWTIFGVTRLDRKLESVGEGQFVRLEYLGTSKTTKNGTAHDFTVQIPEVA